MKKESILALINKFVVAQNGIHKNDFELTNITTNLQRAEPVDVVFYKMRNNEKSIEDFNKRLGQRQPGLLILNSGCESLVKKENCLFIDEDKFLIVQKMLLDEMFPNKNKMKIVGVTGTNGKTTTVNLAMHLSTMAGFPAISVGTIGVLDVNGEILPDLESTTPSYVEFRKIIHKFQDKYSVCFVEVSSHALEQSRLNDIRLDAGAWTSFSQDHLDYHKTMDEYFEAKMKIENILIPNVKIIIPAQEKELFKLILSKHPNANIKIAKTLEERGYIKKPLFYHSSYNQSNAECAFELNQDLWGLEKLKNIALENIKTPNGRFSIIELENNSMAVVDYAHTPDALLNIGSAIKSAFPKHKLTVIFGCGGNRDKTKRPLMGKAVASFADKIIVTSDNPRDEAPEDIILDIINGITSSYEAVIDRKKAIHYALESIEDNECILIAGKGHEEYQEVKGIKHPFSDFQIVKNYSLENQNG